MPDPTSCIRFSSAPPKKAWIILCKTGPIRFGSNGSGQDSSRGARLIGPGSARTQPTRYQVPIFRLGCVLPLISRIVLRKTSLDPIWFRLTVPDFGQTNPVRKQLSRCARIIGSASGQRFRANPDRMQIGSGMFTGSLTTVSAGQYSAFRF